MELLEHKVGAVMVIRPAGPLVGDAAARLRDRVATRVAEVMGRIVLDLEAVSFVDSSGIEALLDISDSLASTGMNMRVCNVTGTVREALTLTAATDSMEFHTDTNAAARSFL